MNKLFSERKISRWYCITPILLFISLIETWSRQFSFCFLCLICFLIDLRILSPMFVNRLYKTKAEYSWRDIEVKDWYMLYLQQQVIILQHESSASRGYPYSPHEDALNRMYGLNPPHRHHYLVKLKDFWSAAKKAGNTDCCTVLLVSPLMNAKLLFV
jgi:hypothetical protein